MSQYRVTIRFGAPKQQYYVEDMSASSLREALRIAAEHYPDVAADTADLAEVRRMRDPDEREPGPE